MLQIITEERVVKFYTLLLFANEYINTSTYELGTDDKVYAMYFSLHFLPLH